MIWGLFPIYWKQLEGISALQLIAHRITWSFVLLGILVLGSGRAGALRGALDRHAARTYLVAALLISVNWFAYVWAVTHGLIVEASLGYYINPLFSVLLGVVLFGERLRPLQWLPIGIAAAAVAYLTLALGSFPWLAVLLAVTFGLYGAVKKTAPLGALFGLTVETGMLFLPAAAYLLSIEVVGSGAFLHGTPREDVMMAGAGIVTAVPLLLFAAAAPRVPMTTIGILQYLTPTMQFLLGIIIYREAFPSARLVGFALVWTGLALFWLEGLFARRSIARA
jgi:chloramphenicol-sensitive protein RarD